MNILQENLDVSTSCCQSPSSLRATDETIPPLRSLGASQFVELPCPLHPNDRLWEERPLLFSERPRSSKRIAPVTLNSNSVFPASELPDELICKVASFLDVPTLSSARCANQRFKGLMSRNEAGWLHLCQRLWSSKLHVLPEAKLWAAAHRAREGYILSCVDATRDEIANEELCYDPQTGRGTIWSFRFKGEAGPQWTAFDPWHAGEEPRRMVFLRDGRVGQIDARNGELRLPFSDAADAHGLEVRWRNVTSPLIDGEVSRRSDAVYIRLRVGGRDVPTYVVHRHHSNWGFLMENCWGLFASFPLRRKRHMPRAATAAADAAVGDARLNANGDAAGGVVSAIARAVTGSKRRKRNTAAAASAAAAVSVKSADVDPLSDSALAVTSRDQWREVLLYNLGGNTLPSGPDAEEIWIRSWENTIQFLQLDAL